MFDSIGRPQSGILSGSLLWPADYDQCLGIQSPTRGGHVITGGYCSTILRTDFNASDFAFDPGSKVVNFLCNNCLEVTYVRTMAITYCCIYSLFILMMGAIWKQETSNGNFII